MSLEFWYLNNQLKHLKSSLSNLIVDNLFLPETLQISISIERSRSLLLYSNLSSLLCIWWFYYELFVKV